MTRSGQVLMVMDVQVGPVALHADSGYIDRAQSLIAGARRAGVPLSYVKAEFRPGYPEVSSASRVYSAIARNGGLVPGDPGVAIHPGVAPEPDDVVVIKRRTSAFSGSDLEIVLRSRGYDTLVLCGLRTSGVLEATLRDAVDRDYSVIALSDLCGDADAELQRVMMEKLFPRYADVMSSATWLQRIAAAAPR